MSEAKTETGLVTAIYARSLLDYLRSQGIEPESLYPRDWIVRLESRTALAQVALNDWAEMFETAIRATKDPDLALKAGAAVKSRHLGVLSEVLICCATLSDVITQLARYIRLLGEIGQPQFSIRDGSAHLLWGWPYPSAPPAALALFMQATRVTQARWLTQRPDFKVDAYFHFARPRDTSLYTRLFGGNLFFDQTESKLVFPEQYLKLPIMSGDPVARARVEARAQAVLRELSGEPPFLRELKTVLNQGLAIGRVSLSEAATALRLSTRTLQRRLEEHNCSFRELLEEVRRNRAEHYLRDPETPLAEIAFLLGYTEQSTFHNAFKRWKGMPPGAFRSRARLAG